LANQCICSGARTRLNAGAWTNLVFPLAWQHFSVDTSDLHLGIQACSVVSLHEQTAEGDICTRGAVVWSLGAWEATLWPAERCGLVGIVQGVLLLQTCNVT
jgi:hypothetical protein